MLCGTPYDPRALHLIETFFMLRVYITLATLRYSGFLSFCFLPQIYNVPNLQRSRHFSDVSRQFTPKTQTSFFFLCPIISDLLSCHDINNKCWPSKYVKYTNAGIVSR